MLKVAPKFLGGMCLTHYCIQRLPPILLFHTPLDDEKFTEVKNQNRISNCKLIRSGVRETHVSIPAVRAYGPLPRLAELEFDDSTGPMAS